MVLIDLIYEHIMNIFVFILVHLEIYILYK